MNKGLRLLGEDLIKANVRDCLIVYRDEGDGFAFLASSRTWAEGAASRVIQELKKMSAREMDSDE